MAKPKIKKVKPPKKRGKGRPSKFEKLDKKQIKVIALMYQRGFTDLEVARILGISRTTIHSWRNKNPDFLNTTKRSKNGANAKVKQAFFERATGYSHPDTKAQWVESEVEIDGEWRTVGRWEYAELIKHYPPDTAAGFIWMKNRGTTDERGKPEEWRDKWEASPGAAPEDAAKKIRDAALEMRKVTNAPDK